MFGQEEIGEYLVDRRTQIVVKAKLSVRIKRV